MKQFLLTLILSILCTSCVITRGKDGEPGKPGNSGSSAVTAVKTTYNQKLADSLGADERGMKTYMLVILKTGPKDALITDKAKREELFKGHFSNMEVMQKAGKLKIAGPFATKNNLQYRGLFLLDVKTEEEAKLLVQQDPTIKEGVFEVEILPWYGSAAIPLYLKHHEEITKTK